MTLAVLRLIGEELRKDRTARVIAQVPVEVATYLINEKREWLRTLEDKTAAELFIVPNENIQTPEYSITRVRDDELELPENKQATYLMPTAPVVSEPGSAQDKRPAQEPAAVATLLPATTAPIAPAPPAAPVAAPAPAAAVHGGFWSRFKKMLAGEPSQAPAPAAEVAAPAPGRAPRREEGSRHEGRRDRPRHSRSGEGARRERGERGGERREGRDRDRDRNRDHRGERSDRGRDGGRRPERERAPAALEAAPRENVPPREAGAPAAESGGQMGSQGAPGDARHERSGRGRRGRRRGRRGGGGGSGAREGAFPAGSPEAGVPPTESVGGFEARGPGNGAPERPPQTERPPPTERPPQAEPPREYHAEPREPVSEHVPLAHFEPAPRTEAAPEQKQPYVVWSSAPAEKSAENRGPEE